MKKFLLGLLAISLSLVATKSNAAVLAGWTFETSIPTTFGPHASETGSGSASFISNAVVTSTASNPAGNGSTESFSLNGWSVGEAFQFSTSTIGFQAINITWDQTGSNTGPRDFVVQYSTDGVTFTTFQSYALPGPAAVGWNTATPNVLGNTSFVADLTSIAAINNLPTAFFRLTQNSTTSINGGTVATTGTGRVDNFVINASAIPEPSSMAALAVIGCGAVTARIRRRRNADAAV